MLLARSHSGDPDAAKFVFSTLFGELHRMAAAFLRAERPGHTLQPTALVNEAYMKLIGPGPLGFESRAHFFGSAARCMRQILIKHAEARRADKRGGDRQRVTLSDVDAGGPGTDVDLLAMEEALVRLEELDERQCRVVELRFFAGMSVEEAALVLGISARTVELDWQMARAWLRRELAA